MGKHKPKSAYNDHLDGEKLSDNTHIRTTLQDSSAPLTQPAQPPLQTHTSGTKKQPPTHFICLPLVTPTSKPQLRASLTRLKHSVARTEIPEKAVRPVSSLHLTLGVMSLTPSSLEAVLEHLASLDLASLLASVTPKQSSPSETQIAEIDTNGITVQLKGLQPMPSRGRGTSVLYAEARDEGERLVRWGEAIRREFEGWMAEGERERGLRVHCTVLNTVYARRGRGGRGGRGGDEGRRGGKEGGGRKGPMKFDPEELMEEYGNFVWAEGVRIDRVQVCKMGARKIRDGRGEVVDEEYEAVGEKMVGGVGS